MYISKENLLQFLQIYVYMTHIVYYFVKDTYLPLITFTPLKYNGA